MNKDRCLRALETMDAELLSNRNHQRRASLQGKKLRRENSFSSQISSSRTTSCLSWTRLSETSRTRQQQQHTVIEEVTTDRDVSNRVPSPRHDRKAVPNVIITPGSPLEKQPQTDVDMLSLTSLSSSSTEDDLTAGGGNHVASLPAKIVPPSKRHLVITSSSSQETIDHLMSETPYRKIFDRRIRFYEEVSSNVSATHGPKSGFCKRRRKNEVFTLNANIQPFEPFVIKHDFKKHGEILCSPDHSTFTTTSDNTDREEVKFTTMHSEDGVESHLEVSMGKEGSVIKASHKRQNEELEDSSVFKVNFQGKVVSIQQSKSVSSLKKSPSASLMVARPRHHGGQRPNSAYCTQLQTTLSSQYVPRYNSMPDLGLNRGRLLAPSELGLLFTPHPADEEKRMAYTRGTCKKL